MKKYIGLAIFLLSFIFIGTNVFASTIIGTDINTAGSLTVSGQSRLKDTLIIGPTGTDAEGFAFPDDWVIPDYTYGAIIFNPALKENSFGAWLSSYVTAANTNPISLLQGIRAEAITSTDSTVSVDTATGGEFEAVNKGVGTITTGIYAVNAIGSNEISNSPAAKVYGGNFRGQQYLSSGTVQDVVGVFGSGKVWNGTATNAYGGHFEALKVSGTLTNAYGVFVDDISTAANNYAIKTGLGTVSFGDKVGISTTTPVANLQVTTGSTNATTTLEVGKANQNKGSCLKLYRTDGTAVYAYIGAGTTALTISTTACATVTNF